MSQEFPTTMLEKKTKPMSQNREVSLKPKTAEFQIETSAITSFIEKKVENLARDSQEQIDQILSSDRAVGEFRDLMKKWLSNSPLLQDEVGLFGLKKPDSKMDRRDTIPFKDGLQPDQSASYMSTSEALEHPDLDHAGKVVLRSEKLNKQLVVDFFTRNNFQESDPNMLLFTVPTEGVTELGEQGADISDVTAEFDAIVADLKNEESDADEKALRDKIAKELINWIGTSDPNERAELGGLTPKFEKMLGTLRQTNRDLDDDRLRQQIGQQYLRWSRSQ